MLFSCYICFFIIVRCRFWLYSHFKCWW